MDNRATWPGKPHRGGLMALLAAVLIAVAAMPGRAATTITVTNTNDSGAGSLRAAIAQANADNDGDIINFNLKGAGQGPFTITLTSGVLTVTGGMSIIGPSAPSSGVTIDGDNNTLIFSVNSGATLNLRYLTLADGYDNDGSAIENAGTLNVNDCTFSNNSDYGNGGAIFSGGTMTVTNSTFANNHGDNFAGGIFNFGSANITNSTFLGNTASDAGAIYNDSDGTLTVTNSTFSDNTASVGGAFYNFGTAIITNATFFANSASDGGAIKNDSTVDLKGTILAIGSNSGGNCQGGVTDEGYNLSDDGSCGFGSSTSQNGVSDSGLKLDPNGLQNNGGPTQTIALLAGSVAIDAIPVADCTDQSDPPVQLTTDQRGVLRPQFTACDIGAYEYDTARSLKTAALAAIQALSGGNRHDRQELQIAASNLTIALRYYWQGNSGNVLNPVLGILDFQAEQRAISALQQILVPGSQLQAALIANYQFNIALADRTLAEVAISGAGGNSQASQLVANGDAASAAGNYSLAIGYYSKAWQLAQ